MRRLDQSMVVLLFVHLIDGSITLQVIVGVMLFISKVKVIILRGFTIMPVLSVIE